MRVHPNEPMIIFKRGEALAELGDREGAKRDFAVAAATFPMEKWRKIARELHNECSEPPCHSQLTFHSSARYRSRCPGGSVSGGMRPATQPRSASPCMRPIGVVKY
jgi:hypothetical protein